MGAYGKTVEGKNRPRTRLVAGAAILLLPRRDAHQAFDWLTNLVSRLPASFNGCLVPIADRRPRHHRVPGIGLTGRRQSSARGPSVEPQRPRRHLFRP